MHRTSYSQKRQLVACCRASDGEYQQKDSLRRHSWTRLYVVCLLFHGFSYLWLPWLPGDAEAIRPVAFPNFYLARRPQCVCSRAIGFRRTCRTAGRRAVPHHHEYLSRYRADYAASFCSGCGTAAPCKDARPLAGEKWHLVATTGSQCGENKPAGSVHTEAPNECSCQSRSH